ncbi:PREDICTED: reticulon-4-interacting protein 1 homolog, mitochondrial isoform X1 [Bactrocera latifrons]|uniref:Reticulon-4-interacting protein 1, mitochondrial n=3 Tax=Bactrocera latifrons TaxID=174628 RepID=A0A0K8UN26_BACLA|nr:PREDICTED: reticulon-4-interacting protein 1 homolog, mitochondrial isoform X1 [Bactrocera latifrons]
MNIRGIKSATGIYLNRLCFTREVATKIPVANENKFPNTNSSLKMDGWQIHNYGTTEELQFATGLRMPIIINSTDCLVRINATTVNPIDVAMLRGYGSKTLNLLRYQYSKTIEFPLILGREFCGEVVQCGMGVDNKISMGDRVYGVVPLHINGSHAQYVVVPEYCLAIAPASLSNEQAASVLYAGLTAWSGLYITGRLGSICGAVSSSGGGENSRILVMGGSGSVGSLAIQLLKSQNISVFATCSDNAIELVKNLGADYVFDYKSSAEFEALRNYGPFDIVLDCTGQGIELAKKLNFQFRQYITFSSPLLKNVDKFGISFGMLKNITHFIQANMKSLSRKGFLLKYGFFMPAPQGIELLTRLVNKNQLLPIIDSSFTFAELPLAFEKVNRGHLRGKVVITMS